MSNLQFRSVIGIEGVNPYVLIGARRAARLRKGWRRPLPVRVRVNARPEKPWRINLLPAGQGRFRLYLHGDLRRASGTKVGETVIVELEFDDAYQRGPIHPLPSWFRAALDRNRRARQTWDDLIPSRRKEILRYFFRLKTADAQARNVRRAIHVLSGGQGRFMGRSWNEEPIEVRRPARVRRQC